MPVLFCESSNTDRDKPVNNAEALREDLLRGGAQLVARREAVGLQSECLSNDFAQASTSEAGQMTWLSTALLSAPAQGKWIAHTPPQPLRKIRSWSCAH